MSQNHAKLTLDGLGFRFGEVTVIDGLCLAVRAGEFLSLLGPSGCGKTTVLRLIAGLLAPTSGAILADGEAISTPGRVAPPERRGMSMIFQNYALWPHMTVAENVAFGLKLRKLSRKAIETQVKEALEAVKLEEFSTRYPGGLSGGQQQRVALARAIALKPKVLLFDEPLSNLDPALRDEMREELRRTHDALAMTSVYVTHDHAEAMSISDRIAILNKGRIEQIGAPQDIYRRPGTVFVAKFFGKTNLLRGRRAEGGLLFDDFLVPFEPSNLGAFPQEASIFSIRPHHIALNAATPDRQAAQGTVQALVLSRTYLGDRWEYQVRPRASQRALRVLCDEREGFEVGAAVSLIFDPLKMAPIRE